MQADRIFGVQSLTSGNDDLDTPLLLPLVLDLDISSKSTMKWTVG